MSDTNKILVGGAVDHGTIDHDGEVTSGGNDITPGDVVEPVDDGDPQEWQLQSTAAEEGVPFYIAVKDYIGGGIDAASTASYADSDGAYSAGEHINVVECQPGVRVNARLATGTNYTFDTKLVYDGNGQLRALDTAGGDTESDVVAVVREANDLSGAGSPDHTEVVTV